MKRRTRVTLVKISVSLCRGEYGWNRVGAGHNLQEAVDDLLNEENPNIPYRLGEKVVIKNKLKLGVK